ncbi:MetQ/NlpA family ABC transporter substrate-binding protein [Rhodobaculum claviforme]|uniref:MetQ/NlpA family ABC transporter substrate-binding protein n=1 Tax=Rhodobaculum claviforme TaxID=1549854 RepID=UPI001912A7B1|nr:MetQ/NlpA family ABC transporter substrate-binding protein [Rhodobaculum claviforme]
MSIGGRSPGSANAATANPTSRAHPGPSASKLIPLGDRSDARTLLSAPEEREFTRSSLRHGLQVCRSHPGSAHGAATPPRIAADLGLEIAIVECTDHVVPNRALLQGALDAISFQHQPCLDNQNANAGFDPVSVGLTETFPPGIPCSRHAAWEDLPEGATIATRNEPTKGGRSLVLLRDAGAIALAEDVGAQPTLLDIMATPSNLRFIEIDAAQTPRSRQDVDAAAINASYAGRTSIPPPRSCARTRAVPVPT